MRFVGLRPIARDEGGFSLIELITALSILLIVVGSLTTLFVSAMRSEVDVTQRVRVQQEARLAIERIRHEIHRACKAEHVNLATGMIFVPAPGVAYSNIRLTPPVSSTCLPTVAATAITWCMGATTDPQRWTLRRVVGTPTPTCLDAPDPSKMRIEADFITTDAVFTLEPSSVVSLAKVKVTFPVDLKPAERSPAYRLEDNLVLRNSVRG